MQYILPQELRNSLLAYFEAREESVVDGMLSRDFIAGQYVLFLRDLKPLREVSA